MYTDFKNELLSKQVAITSVDVSKIKFITDSVIEVNNRNYKITQNAFKNVLSILGITTKFAKKFTELFSEKGKRQLLSLLMNAASASEGLTVLLYGNKQTLEICQISKYNGNPYNGNISKNETLSLIEDILNSDDLSIKNYNVGFDGSWNIDLLKNKEIDLNIPNEIFNFGLSIRGNIEKTNIIPFNNRLICSNGMKYPTHYKELTVNSMNEEKWHKFYSKLEEMKTHHYIPSDFIKNINKSKNINASMYEVEEIYSLIHPVLKNDTDSFLNKEEYITEYKKIGVNYDTLTHEQKMTANSPIKYWDLINVLTDVASHDYGEKFDKKKMDYLQVKSGEFMVKTPQLANIITANPF